VRKLLIVLVDNYDSFTYNLYSYIRLIASDVRVVRNDRVSIAQLRALRPDAIVISPGPKEPKDAGISNELIRACAGTCPILGVCLGHQCINEVFGGRTVRAPEPCHGKTSRITHDARKLFVSVPQSCHVARYHSLVADPSHVGSDLEVTAQTEEGIVMGLRHRRWPIEGVQFHPESFLTEHGATMLWNFFDDVRGGSRGPQ
jgi:anthranilate synthase/aminodeoxychorismate synthase-like glutamine amidotransferase